MPESSTEPASPADAGDTAASWVMFGVGYPLSCAFVGLVTHRVALAYNPQSIKAAGGAITQLTCVASSRLKSRVTFRSWRPPRRARRAPHTPAQPALARRAGPPS